MKILKVFFCILVAVILTGIFWFSAQPATQSNNLSVSFTEKIVEFLPVVRDYTPEQKAELAIEWNGYIRKYAHFSLYCLLGIVVSGGALLSFRAGIWKRWCLALVFCLICAVGDEIHQLFVPGRSCELKDVLIDFGGSFLGCLLVMGLAAAFHGLRGRKKGQIREKNH